MKTKMNSHKFLFIRLLLFTMMILTLSNTSFSSDWPQTKVTSNWFDTKVELPIVDHPIFNFIPNELISIFANIPENVALNQSIDIFLTKNFLSASEGVTLKVVFSQVYKEIENDPSFGKDNPPPIFNFLPGRNSKKGHYYLYSPKSEPDQSIIFLHGFGGNLKFYIWAVKKAFPNSQIFFPSWGISCGSINSEYLNEMIQDASKKYGVKTIQPWLFAISGSGPGGFRIYSSNSNFFKGYVSIASSPRKNQVDFIAPDSRILMINGLKDKHYPIEEVRKLTKRLIEKVKSFKFAEIDSDHFFILTKHNETFSLIKTFMNQLR